MKLEVLYRRCNSSEAAKSIAAKGLLVESHMLKIRGTPAKCDSSKWVSNSRKKTLEYMPNGVDPEDYRYCIVLKVAPGTVDALQMEKREGAVRRGRNCAYGIPPELVGWFNGRVVEVETYDLTAARLPLYSDENTLHLLRAEDGKFACFVSFSPQMLEHGKTLQFNEEFSTVRKSWLKTSLLWALWRGDWARKEGQECLIQINLPPPEISFLVENAVSTKIPGKHEILCQYDPDRRIISRRWLEGKDFFVRAGKTAHFAIPSSRLKEYAEKYGLNDITSEVKGVFEGKAQHPTHALYEKLKLEPEEYCGE